MHCEVQRATVRGDLAWRDKQLHDKRLVVGRHDDEDVWSGADFEVAIVPLEILDETGIGTVDIHLRAPRLDIQLNSTRREAIEQRQPQLRIANIYGSDPSIGQPEWRHEDKGCSSRVELQRRFEPALSRRRGVHGTMHGLSGGVPVALLARRLRKNKAALSNDRRQGDDPGRDSASHTH